MRGVGPVTSGEGVLLWNHGGSADDLTALSSSQSRLQPRATSQEWWARCIWPFAIPRVSIRVQVGQQTRTDIIPTTILGVRRVKPSSTR